LSVKGTYARKNAEHPFYTTYQETQKE